MRNMRNHNHHTTAQNQHTEYELSAEKIPNVELREFSDGTVGLLYTGERGTRLKYHYHMEDPSGKITGESHPETVFIAATESGNHYIVGRGMIINLGAGVVTFLERNDRVNEIVLGEPWFPIKGRGMHSTAIKSVLVDGGLRSTENKNLPDSPIAQAKELLYDQERRLKRQQRHRSLGSEALSGHY